MNWQTMCMILAYLILFAAAVQDLKHKEIMAWSLGAAGGLSAVACAVEALEAGTAGREALVQCLLGAAIALLPGLLLLVIAFVSRQGMGYGDGLLALCIGPCFGVRRMTAGLLLALLLCAVCSGVLLMRHKAGRKTGIPFVPFLTAAMGVTQLVF